MLVDHARIAHLLGDATSAETSLVRATELYEHLGAPVYVARIDAARQASGKATPGRKQAVLLTEREQDVLTLIASGMSYAQIARDLFVTQSTVGYHLSNIYRKAGVGSRHELTELVRSDPLGFGIAPS
jgi:DNA-binding NarL/FixJ family response regulator